METFIFFGYAAVWLIVWMVWFRIVWNDEGRPEDVGAWAGCIISFCALGVASIFWPLILGVLGLATVFDRMTRR